MRLLLVDDSAHCLDAARRLLISAHPEVELQELIDASPAFGFLPKSELSGGAVRALLRERSREDSGDVSGDRGT